MDSIYCTVCRWVDLYTEFDKDISSVYVRFGNVQPFPILFKPRLFFTYVRLDATDNIEEAHHSSHYC